MFGVVAAVLAGIAGEGLIKLIEMIAKHYGDWALVAFYSLFFATLLCIGFAIWLSRRKYVSFLKALMYLAESNLQESSARLEEYENERLDESTVARMKTFYDSKVK